MLPGGIKKLLELVKRVLNEKPSIQSPLIYIVAEDIGTTEIPEYTGVAPLTAESSKSNANEGAGEADPNWSEDIHFESDGTITVVSISYEIYYHSQRRLSLY